MPIKFASLFELKFIFIKNHFILGLRSLPIISGIIFASTLLHHFNVFASAPGFGIILLIVSALLLASIWIQLNWKTSASPLLLMTGAKYLGIGHILERCVISQAKPPDCVSAEKDGKKVNGPVKIFNKQNKLLSDLNFMNGKLHGTVTFYFLSGKISSIAEYKNGEIIRRKNFYESGSVEYEQKEDKSATLYDEDGNVLSSGSEKELLQQMANLAR